MNKREAVKMFKESLACESCHKFHVDDEVKVREDWGIYIDGLCKDGDITQRQYETWEITFNGT